MRARSSTAGRSERSMTRAIENDADRIAVAVMRDRLSADLEGYQAGAPWRQLSAFDSPLSFIRMAFDLSPRETPEDWERIATRMSRVPDAIAGFTELLRYGLATGRIAARRQALVCAEQAATLGGLDSGQAPYFSGIAAEAAHDNGLERAAPGGRSGGDGCVRGDVALPARGVRPAGAGCGRRGP